MILELLEFVKTAGCIETITVLKGIAAMPLS